MHQSILDVFAETVSTAGHSIALEFNQQRWSYAELDQYSNILLQRLNDERVPTQQPIGVYLERGPWLIASILAIFKHGGTYIPLDTHHPRQRTEFIIDDATLQHVISNRQNHDRIEHIKAIAIINIDHLELTTVTTIAAPQAIATAHQHAYSIYTSGTTGTPKGVKVSHHNLLQLFTNTQNLFDFKPSDRWCLFHSPSFDFSIWEIFGALYSGATLVIPERTSCIQTDAFHHFLNTKKITILNQTPSAFYQLNNIEQTHCLEQSTENASLTELRIVIFGGEALNTQRLQSWLNLHPLNKTQLINMYGITETTVHASFKQLSNKDILGIARSNIGKALPGSQIVLLDEHQQSVDNNQAGEMYIYGPGVSLGYHARPQLNAEKFINLTIDTAAPNMTVRAYRSGDLAMRLDSGDLIYLGRKDRQVKIRGFRIELAEIESTLNKHSSVNNCLVIAHQYNELDQRLLAFIVPAPHLNQPHSQHQQSTPEQSIHLHQDQHAEAQLATFLKSLLPAYMLPNHFYFINKIPLNNNHKADKQALISLLDTYTNLSKFEQRTPTNTSIEKTLISLWEHLLKVQLSTTTDQFYELGGHSLLAIQLLSQIQKKWHITIKVSDLEDDFSIAKLASIIRQSTAPT